MAVTCEDEAPTRAELMAVSCEDEAPTRAELMAVSCDDAEMIAPTGEEEEFEEPGGFCAPLHIDDGGTGRPRSASEVTIPSPRGENGDEAPFLAPLHLDSPRQSFDVQTSVKAEATRETEAPRRPVSSPPAPSSRNSFDRAFQDALEALWCGCGSKSQRQTDDPHAPIELPIDLSPPPPWSVLPRSRASLPFDPQTDHRRTIRGSPLGAH